MDTQKTVIVVLVGLVLIIASVWAISTVFRGEEASRGNENEEETISDDITDTQADTDVEITESKEHLQGANTEGAVAKKHLANAEIEIKNHLFEPTALTVSTNTTVTWTNESNSRHYVTSTDGSPSSGLNSEPLNGDETYSFTFENPGIYEYVCTRHPDRMRAVIKVVEGSG